MEKKTLMTERERLIEIFKNTKYKAYECTPETTVANQFSEYALNHIVDEFLKKGVIVPPCKVVWYIENRCTEYQCVTGVSIENLPLHIVRNLDKYRYYATKEEAEKALKGAEK